MFGRGVAPLLGMHIRAAGGLLGLDGRNQLLQCRRDRRQILAQILGQPIQIGPIPFPDLSYDRLSIVRIEEERQLALRGQVAERDHPAVIWPPATFDQTGAHQLVHQTADRGQSRKILFNDLP